MAKTLMRALHARFIFYFYFFLGMTVACCDALQLGLLMALFACGLQYMRCVYVFACTGACVYANVY